MRVDEIAADVEARERRRFPVLMLVENRLSALMSALCTRMSAYGLRRAPANVRERVSVVVANKSVANAQVAQQRRGEFRRIAAACR
jgi:hypothetical protein